MNEALKTFCPVTLQAIAIATSLPALEDGLTPCVLPDGRTISPYGLARALVNLSARQVKALGLQTSGTCGQPGSTSSRSAALQSSLENRLRARMPIPGSSLYTLTWKEWATPSGASRSRLRASALRTSGIEITGWPTPAARDFKSESATDEFNERRWDHARGKPPSAVATLVGWPTCTVQDSVRGVKDARPHDTGQPLGQIAALAGWPTPMAGTPAQNGNNEAGNNDSSRKTVALSMDSPARYTATGRMLTGSCAGMESGAQLNPVHSRWLMGYPPEWCDCAVTAMQSFPSKPRHSSKQA